jgi:hypothetical protein
MRMKTNPWMLRTVLTGVMAVTLSSCGLKGGWSFADDDDEDGRADEPATPSGTDTGDGDGSNDSGGPDATDGSNSADGVEDPCRSNPGGSGCPCYDVFTCTAPLLCNLNDNRCTECLADADCGRNEFCDTDNTCKPTEVTEGCAAGQAPLIQLSRDQVRFGCADIGDTLEESVRITNIGQCPLRIYSANLKDATVPGFECENCSDGPEALDYPLTLQPFTDRVDIRLSYTETRIVPDASAVLVIASSDATIPIITVGLYGGCDKRTGELEVSPTLIDFGFTKLGSTAKKRVTLTNTLKQADGNTPLVISKIEIKGDQGSPSAFRFSQQSLDAAGPMPWNINPEDAVDVEIEYTPLTEADHLAFLVIDSNDDAKDAINYPIRGGGNPRPVCTFDPPTGSTIDFGQIVEKTSATRPFVIANRGGENCVISASFSTISDPEFTLATPTVPDLGAGQQATNKIVFAPQTPGTYTGQITFFTNDPTAPEVKYTMQGEAAEKLATDVLRIELAADTPSGNIFGNSFQIADVSYEEAITGLVADRRNQSPNWTNLGSRNYGQPKWATLGSPYPIVVSHTDAQIDDSCYNVAAVYVEDCSFVPSSLLASIGGIITGAIIGSLGVPGGGGLDISSVCLARDSFDATLRVDINGVPKASKAISLGTKGDRVNAFTIRRRGGLFKVDPYNPGLCSVP